jgi:hypothetical protein
MSAPAGSTPFQPIRIAHHGCARRIAALLTACAGLALGADPLAGWRAARIAPVGPPDAHSIHAYFNASPESPDGKQVLYYASTDVDADSGQLVVVERATGQRRVVARIAKVEDAHRAACQQWSDGGRGIAFHDCRAGRWLVAVADPATGAERILAQDRQLGFGAVADHRVPIYGCHWNPGAHRDLEFADVRDGTVTTAVAIADVVSTYGDWVRKEFVDDAVSVFFPVVSPDGRKVFFKVARGRGGDDFRGMDASHRDGKVVWDLAAGRPIRLLPTWGHPSWAPDSGGIFEKGNVLTTLVDGANRQFAKGSPSDHPSLSPDGRLFVTDADISRREGSRPGEWGIIVGSTADDGTWIVVHRFLNTGGATSWRHPHPHPAFSADGRRIYFNVSEGPWTRLHVAEAAP